MSIEVIIYMPDSVLKATASEIVLPGLRGQICVMRGYESRILSLSAGEVRLKQVREIEEERAQNLNFKQSNESVTIQHGGIAKIINDHEIGVTKCEIISYF